MLDSVLVVILIMSRDKSRCYQFIISSIISIFQTSFMLSHTEENYLKAIYKITERDGSPVTTNAIAAAMGTSAASVTDMLKRLNEKEFLAYERYKGAALTTKGNWLATLLVRKHRLWEVFLVDKLKFSWDEVHEIAEELEHIESEKLISRLDKYLGYPKFDPHGDPIPDELGVSTARSQQLLCDFATGESGIVVGVNEHSTVFLQHLEKIGLTLGTPIKVLEVFEYDQSMKIQIKSQNQHQILTLKVTANVFCEVIR
jgi:DtxR family transcriptional regulator, Mn-dependent transcriptional regulator